MGHYEVTVKEALPSLGRRGVVLTVWHDKTQVEDVTNYVGEGVYLPDLLESMEEQKRRLLEAYSLGWHDALEEKDPATE